MKKYLYLAFALLLALFPLLAFAQSSSQPNTGGSPLSSPAEASEIGTMLLLSTIYGLFVRPLLDWVINKTALPNEISGVVMGIITLALYLLLWKVIGGTTSDTPTDWQHWLTAALSALGVGSITSSTIQTVKVNKT